MSGSSLISVIIPAYNAERTIKKCINSALRQSYENVEILVIDDGSNDETAAICSSLAKITPQLVYFRVAHRGVSAARNYGIAMAKGEWILFLDSDDVLLEHAIEDMVYTAGHFGTDISAGAMSFEAASGLSDPVEMRFFDTRRIDYLSSCFEKLYKSNYLQSSCSKVFNRRALLNHALYFDERLNSYEDLDFVLRCLSAGLTMSVTDKVCYRYLRHTNGSGSTTYKADMTNQMELVASRFVCFWRSQLSDLNEHDCWEYVVRLLVVAVNNAAAAEVPASRRILLIKDVFVRKIFSEAAAKANVFPNRYSELLVHAGLRGNYLGVLLLATLRNRVRSRHVA